MRQTYVASKRLSTALDDRRRDEYNGDSQNPLESRMKATLEPGISRKERITIDADRTIGFLGEALRLYSTPSMVRDVETLSHVLASLGVAVARTHSQVSPAGDDLLLQTIDPRPTTAACR